MSFFLLLPIYNASVCIYLIKYFCDSSVFDLFVMNASIYLILSLWGKYYPISSEAPRRTILIKVIILHILNNLLYHSTWVC